jgi:hypothetical protein
MINDSMIDEIRQKIAIGQYEYPKHAVNKTIKRGIAVNEIAEAIASRSMIIEDYPDEKSGPSCLIFGITEAGRPMYIQCSYPDKPMVKIMGEG